MKAVATLPSPGELESHWLQKYGPAQTIGWQPTRRRRFGYHLPADFYESLVDGLLRPGARWLDVGGGHSIFPENPRLAKQLAARCSRVVAVDPSENVNNNPFVHERVQSFLEDFRTTERFDVATMRMVVEHVANPSAFVGALAGLLAPSAVVIVFTVSLWSPVTLISRIVPFKFHNGIKQMVWGSNESDTFPVHYRMNTKSALRRLFGDAGFTEEMLVRLDDLSALGRFKWLSYADILFWRALHTARLPYPDGCLLGVFRRHST